MGQSTSGVEDATGLDNWLFFSQGGRFANVEPFPIYVDTHRTFAKAKRLLQDGWSAPVPTTKHAHGTNDLRQHLDVNTFRAVISDALQKPSRKALVVHDHIMFLSRAAAACVEIMSSAEAQTLLHFPKKTAS